MQGPHLWSVITLSKPRATGRHDEIDIISAIGPEHELTLDLGRYIRHNSSLGNIPFPGLGVEDVPQDGLGSIR